MADKRLGASHVCYSGHAELLMSMLASVFVTGNPMKLQEVRAILSQSGVEIDSQNLDSMPDFSHLPVTRSTLVSSSGASRNYAGDRY